MNVFKKVLGHLFFFYAMMLFLVLMFIIALPMACLTYFMSEPRRSVVLHPVYKLWISILMPMVFSPVKRKGKEKFKKGENYVVVINHNSLVDIPVSTPWIPGPNKTLAKIELSKIPIFNIIYKSGSILVDRKSEESRKRSFVEMQNTLKMGLHLCLYPEGTRNKTDQPLLPFYEGAFITAIKAQKPIIPGLIFHTRKILPQKPKFWAWPHKIDYHFLDPIPTEGLTLQDVVSLKEKVRKIMEDYIIANKN